MRYFARRKLPKRDHFLIVALLLSLLMAGCVQKNNQVPTDTKSSTDTKILVDAGESYRIWPYTDKRGRTVFTLAASDSSYPSKCLVYEINDFEHIVSLGNLLSIDSRNTTTGQPFITNKDTILIPVWKVAYYDNPANTYFTIYRLTEDKHPKRVFLDEQGSYGIHFHQSDDRKEIYLGYRTQTNAVIIKSNDDGASWTTIYNQAWPYPVVYSMVAHHNTILASLRNEHKLLRSTDNGETWSTASFPTGTRSLTYYRDLSIGGTVFLSGDGCIYYSEDLGATWTKIKFNCNAPLRYPIRLGAYFLVSAPGFILGSQDMYHSVFPIVNWDGYKNASRISGYGNILFVGSESDGTLTRVSLTSIPSTQRQANSIILWDNVFIDRDGLVSNAINTSSNIAKTFCLISDQHGTMYVQTYEEMAGEFRDIDSRPVLADCLTTYETTMGSRLMSLRFVPAVEANVSSWCILN